MNSWLVNWLPWSVLKISGLPYLARAFLPIRSSHSFTPDKQEPPREN